MKFKPKSVLQGKELEYFQQARDMLASLMHSLDDDLKIIQVKHVTITPDNQITFL